MDKAEELKKFAQKAATGDRIAMRAVVEATYSCIERGINKALFTHGDGNWRAMDQGSAVFDSFLEKKLGEARFLLQVAAADQPLGFVHNAARNFTIDALRAPRVVTVASRFGVPKGVVEDEPREEEVDIDQEVPSDATAVEAVARRQALETLPVERRVLLKIRHHAELSADEFSWLLNARNTPAYNLRLLLDERAARASEAATEKASRLLRLRERLAVAHDTFERVLRLIDELDGHPAPPDPDITSLGEFGNMTRLRRGRPAQRSAVAQIRQQQVRTLAEKLERMEASMGNARAAQPNWEEIAILLGRVAADAPVAARETARNTVQAAADRAERKLEKATRLLLEAHRAEAKL
jgi:hypothetical protein